MRVILLIVLLAPQAASAVLLKKNCKVEFSHNSVVFDDNKLRNCLKGGPPEYVRVFGTSTPDGSSLYNMRLSYRRAEKVAAIVTDMFPTAHVQADGGGINPELGRQASVFAVKAQPEKGLEALKAGPYVVQTPLLYRLGVDAGVAALGEDIYQAYSLSLERIFGDGWGLGVRSSQLATESALNLNTAYLSGSYITSLGKSNVSLTALAGVVRSPIDAKFDGGVEARISSQNRIQIFLALSRTIHFFSIGGGVEAHI